MGGSAERFYGGSGRSRVRVDTSQAMAALTKIEGITSGKDTHIWQYGAELLAAEMERAFREKVDPETDRPWPARKREYPWPLLNRTGALRASVDTGWGITRSGKPRLFGRAKDGLYFGKPIILVVGAVQFGRSKHRTPKGTKKPKIAPSTGITPPRPFFGFGRSAQQKFSARYEQLIKEANV